MPAELDPVGQKKLIFVGIIHNIRVSNDGCNVIRTNIRFLYCKHFDTRIL